ncbi:MAG: hypothetical protein EXS37_19370 [Opitutus sp.]|nr:hypothetical protein [Opitutus sp.]
MDVQRHRVAEIVEAWRRVADMEAALKAKELPQLSTAQALAYLAPAFQYAAGVSELRPGSGLVVQQSWFSRYRERHPVQ